MRTEETFIIWSCFRIKGRVSWSKISLNPLLSTPLPTSCPFQGGWPVADFIGLCVGCFICGVCFAIICSKAGTINRIID